MLVRVRPTPYLCYVVSFGTALLVYSAGWSELYPSLRSGLLAFLIVSGALFVSIERLWPAIKKIDFNAIEVGDRSAVIVTAIIYFGWLAEFIYEGGIPVIKIILAIPYDYRLFGIPTFHVLIVTFSSYYTLYLFHAYLSRKRKVMLILFALNLMAAVLIYSRAMLFFNLAGSMFIFLTFTGGVTVRQLLWVGVSIALLFYVFGVLGSLRVSRIAKQPYNNENFMETGGATTAFRESIVPKEYFWAYIYISSPLANLQQNINLDPGGALTAKRIVGLINSEILPDFISKRTTDRFRLPIYIDSRIPGPFNVSTTYSRAYSYAGWTGMVIMAFLLALFPICYVWLLPPTSRFFVSGWCLLCTMYFFSVYDNTFRFTGLSFQLVYPILLHWLDLKWKNLSRVF